MKISIFVAGRTTKVVMSWMQQLGEEIAKARRRAGLTQAQLGDMVRVARREAGLTAEIGVSRQMIGLYEKGEVPPPFETLACIASVLGAERFVVEDLKVTFNRNGASQQTNPPAEQLELIFDQQQGVTLRIEPSGTGLTIKAVSA